MPEVVTMMKHLLLALALTCTVTVQGHAGPTHSFIRGPFTSGPEVTRTCIHCHPGETETFMKTVHWTWSKKQTVNGKSVAYGKKNAIGSSFCFALPSNWPGCTSCHAGYGWSDGTFDFSRKENIDCLVCHETTGSYKKFPSAAGHPVYEGETREAPTGTAWEPADLAAAARSVALPNRTACGACHFYSGGADNAKHGDLAASLANPTPEIDIHMGGNARLTCESCHQAANHDVKGEALSVSSSSAPRAFNCGHCHQGKIHKSVALNNHLKRVACQTCHIPTFAKGTPTVMSWDWSTAGKDGKPEEAGKEGTSLKLYDKARGDLVLAQDVKPAYFWYNGATDRVYLGDKIDPSKVVQLTAPKGERRDPDARIFPFKIMTGKQPYDVENRTLVVANIFGLPGSETAFSTTFDWNKAIAAGMKAAGEPYSGKFGWVQTSMVWSLNHMIAPKEKALRCPDCHVEKGGPLNWQSLGYRKDPR